jgi:hypothetical protein
MSLALLPVLVSMARPSRRNLAILAVLLVVSSALDTKSHRILAGASTGYGHWSLSIAALVFIGIGFVLSLWGRYIVKITVILSGFIFGWLVLSDVAYRLAVDNGKDEESANNIALVFGIIGAVVLAALAYRVFKIGFFILGCLFGILLASTLNTSFLHNIAASIAGQNNVGWVCMAMFGLAFGILFYCFKESVVIIASAFIGAYLLFYGIGYYAGNFPNTFDISQSINHQPMGKVPTEWYAYFTAIIIWTILGIYVQYKHTSKKSKGQQPAKKNGGAQGL